MITYAFAFFLVKVFDQIAEVYLEYLIVGIMNVLYSLDKPYGEVVGLIYAYECLCFTLVLFPIMLAYTLLMPRENFQNQEYINVLCSFYNSVRKDTDWGLCYYVIFILRRIGFLFIGFWCSD